MIRPRDARTEQLGHLLAVARDMFGRRGFHGTSMEDIAVGLQVSKPTLYRHFPGKHELYFAVAQDAAQEMVRSIRAAARDPQDNESRCRAAARSYFDAVFSPDGVASLFLSVDARTSPEIAALVEWASQACVEAIADVVAEETDLDRARARLVAAGLVGVCTATARHTAETGHDRDEALGLIYRLLWQGVGSFPTAQPDTGRTP